MINRKDSKRVIEYIIKVSKNWISCYGDDCELIDPLEDAPIRHHYGDTHFAVSLLLLGLNTSNNSFISLGEKMIEHYLNSWDSRRLISEFHFDFNNFALCILLDYYDENSSICNNGLYKKIKSNILISPDSNHYTINWLPMRIYVNNYRYIWTKDVKYLNRINKLNKIIKKSINSDYLIEDKLPKGVSYNPQYNISTVALLSILNDKFGMKYPILRLINSINSLVDPEGDVNYFGRGTNQIFAWGPWMYISYRHSSFVNINSNSYFFERIFSTLDNEQIFLSSNKKKSTILWWDYHYLSVYTSHLLFWLTLGIISSHKNTKINKISNYNNHSKLSSFKDTGVFLTKNSDIFIAIFSGRKEYFSERGISLVNIWTKKNGTIFKGPYGTWNEKFGSKYFGKMESIFNYFGPLNINFNKKGQKIFLAVKKITVSESETYTEILYHFNKRSNSFFNLPIFIDKIGFLESIRIFIDGNRTYLFNTGQKINSYGKINVFKTKVEFGSIWKVRIYY